VKLGDPTTPLLLRYAIINATNYDILVGQHAFHPFGFGLNIWIEEAWIRPGRSDGYSRREFIHVASGIATTIAPLSMVLGCGATMDTFLGRSLGENHRTTCDKKKGPIYSL
jgi:hypothetical protein